MKKLAALLAASLATLSTPSYGWGDAEELRRAVEHRESGIFCGPPLLSTAQKRGVFLCTNAEPPNFDRETTLWLAVRTRFSL